MKSVVVLFTFLLFSSAHAWSQQQPAAEDVRMEKTLTKGSMVFKPVRPAEDNVEMIEVVGLGTPSFKVSNTADGTYSSYEHALRVAYPLVVSGGKSGYMLCFYGPTERMPYSVETKAGVTTLYFPVSTHDVIKARIEQIIALKKKIVFKITQLADGYREALVGGN
ncbi:MAG: hypothetical protein ACKOA3_04670 [Sphingomonadales bacterium]